MRDLRDALVRSALSDSELDLSTLHPICAAAGVDPVGDRQAGADGLAFSWLHKRGDAELARRHIGAVVAALADLPGDERALAAVTAELASAEGDRFAALVDEQAALRDRIARARTELNELARGDDARAAATG